MDEEDDEGEPAASLLPVPPMREDGEDEDEDEDDEEDDGQDEVQHDEVGDGSGESQEFEE